jgi:putative transposase
MKRSRFTEAQILAVLKDADAGRSVAEICRKHGISDQTYYNWKAKYGGATLSELKRLRELEAENAKLKRMYADLALENEAIKVVLGRKL